MAFNLATLSLKVAPYKPQKKNEHGWLTYEPIKLATNEILESQLPSDFNI